MPIAEDRAPIAEDRTLSERTDPGATESYSTGPQSFEQMLPEALGAPTRSHDATGTIAIGGMLLLFSVFFPLLWLLTLTVSPIWFVLAPLAVFPPLVTLGYDLRVMEAGLRENRATPPFLGWAQLARDGARSILLGVVYLVPALVVLTGASLLVAGVQTGQFELSDRVVTAVTGVTTAGASAFVLLYLVVFLYIRPATLAVFVATGRLGAALSPRRVLHVALSGEYAIGWAIAAVVLLIGWVIAAPLQLLIVGFFVAFYVRSIAYYVYGNGARTRLPTMDESPLSAGAVSRERPPERDGMETPSDASSATEPGGRSPTAEQPEAPPEPRRSRPSWSPKITPEAPGDVQVGRSVPLSDAGRDGRDDESGAEADPSGTSREADSPAGGSGANDGERDREGDSPQSGDVEDRPASGANTSFEWASEGDPPGANR